MSARPSCARSERESTGGSAAQRAEWSSRGFTLLELLMVMAILGGLSVVAATSWVSAVDARSTAALKRELIELDRRARVLAAKEGGVVLVGDREGLGPRGTGQVDGLVARSLSSGEELLRCTVPAAEVEVRGDEGVPVVVDRRGRCPTYSVVVSLAGGPSLRLRFVGPLGVVDDVAWQP